MPPDWNGLRAKYEELSEYFITQVNATSLTLYYPPQTGLTPVSGTIGVGPSNIDSHGAPVPLNTIPPLTHSSDQNYAVVPTGETILTRSYWLNRNMDEALRKIGIADNNNYCKIITYSELAFKLRNADYAITEEGIKIKMIKDPVPYGLLGVKQYCVSYWEEI